MTIIRRKKKTTHYTPIHNQVIRDGELSLKARGLHHLLLSFPEDWEIKVEYLIQICKKDGKDSIRSGLKELREAGYLQQISSRDKGKFTCDYVITEFPNESLEDEEADEMELSTDTENPDRLETPISTDTENPDRSSRSGKTGAEKPERLNRSGKPASASIYKQKNDLQKNDLQRNEGESTPAQTEQNLTEPDPAIANQPVSDPPPAEDNATPQEPALDQFFAPPPPDVEAKYWNPTELPWFIGGKFMHIDPDMMQAVYETNQGKSWTTLRDGTRNDPGIRKILRRMSTTAKEPLEGNDRMTLVDWWCLAVAMKRARWEQERRIQAVRLGAVDPAAPTLPVRENIKVSIQSAIDRGRGELAMDAIALHKFELSDFTFPEGELQKLTQSREETQQPSDRPPERTIYHADTQAPLSASEAPQNGFSSIGALLPVRPAQSKALAGVAASAFDDDDDEPF